MRLIWYFRSSILDFRLQAFPRFGDGRFSSHGSSLQREMEAAHRFNKETPRLTFGDRMITVTDSAVRQLKSLLNGDAQTSRKGLRVQIAKGGCSGLQYEMALDEPHVGDAVVE